MPIQELADNTAKEIITSLGSNIDKSRDVSRIVEKALVTVLREARVTCVDVVNTCCSSDQDLAHKISNELRKKETALIANLSSLR